MNKKLLKLCLCACAAFGFAACSTGEYNDLKCDPSTYIAECLAGNVFMTCDSGTLKVDYCQGNDVCKPRPEGAICAPRGEEGACVTTCMDGNSLKKCNPDGSSDIVDCRTVQEGYVCSVNQCQPPSTECTSVCLEDDVTLMECQSNGTKAPKLCSDLGAGYTCGLVDGKAQCKAPQDCESYCDEDDSDILHQCDENGNHVEVNCSEQGDAFTCNQGACVETCEADTCDEDGITLKVCNDDGIFEPVDCSQTDEICSHSECVAPSSIVGMPCHCDGTDEECTITYTGAELKSVFTDAGIAANESYYNKIGDDELLVFPNIYSNKNVGCEELQDFIIENGYSNIMTAACYRSFEVVKPASIINIIGNDFVEILDGYLSNNQTDAFRRLADALDNFNTVANGGYCLPVALNVNAEVAGRVEENLKKEMLTSDGEIFGKINTGDIPTLITTVAVEDVCPTNSTFFRYKFKKSARSSAKLKVNFGMCLMNCESDADCRDNYSCVEVPANGLASKNHLISVAGSDDVVVQKVCVMQDNISELMDLKDNINDAINVLISKE